MKHLKDSYLVDNAEDMMLLGAVFAAKAKFGDVYALVGELGAGKTHWSKGFVGHIDPTSKVTSPTFSMVNEYREGKIAVYHFDFYRLKSEEELISLGWDEYLDAHGIVICEWANLFPELIPSDATWIEIKHHEGERRLFEFYNSK